MRRDLRRRRRSAVSLLVLPMVVAFAGPPNPSVAQEPVLRTYITMSDGVKIAVAVAFPSGFDLGERWPVLFEIDGYDGAANPIPNTGRYADKYILVGASVRGTGCSGGNFDLFSERSARDGFEIIENWIVHQPWSDGKVGVTGLSYPGLQGLYVAAMNPPHLRAVAVSGVVDDYYRGLMRMGGIFNAGFPVLWAGVLRVTSDWAGNRDRWVALASQQDPTCAENVVSRQPSNAVDPSLLAAFASNEEDSPGSWTRTHSPILYLDGIRAPVHISHTYQDEATGARGGIAVWERIAPEVPKRLAVTNGRHASNFFANADRQDWLDCWVILEGRTCPGDVLDPAARVRVHFESTGAERQLALNPPLRSADFPLPETAWRRYYLRPGELSTESPAGSEPADAYVSAPAGPHALPVCDPSGSRSCTPELQTSSAATLPDAVSYRARFDQPVAIMGPVPLTLWATSTATDTDFFAEIVDVSPDGSRQPLQRGMLRASHRALDESRSDRIVSGPHAGEIYRPWHPHEQPAPIIPEAPQRYDIEIFPIGHVFRAGHSIELVVRATPPTDPVSEIYFYAGHNDPALNSVLHDAVHPSSLLLPILPSTPPLGAEPGCGEQVGVRCERAPLSPP